MIMSKGLVFHSITLIDFPFFKKQTFVLDSGHINLVLGQNFNGGGGASNPNGAGKSLFFSQIVEFITDEPVVGVKKDKIRRGTRILEFSKSGKRYKATRSFSEGKEKITIECNGKDLGIRELKAGKELIDSVIGLSREELYTFVYLDSQVGHPLIHGDTAARKSFFVSFFKQFGVLSNFRKLVAAQVDLCKGDLIRIEEAQARMNALKAKLPSTTVKKLKDTVDALHEESESLATTVPELVRANGVREKYFAIRSTLRSLCLETQVNSLDDITVKRKELRATGRLLSQQQDVLDRYEEWAKSNSDTAARLDELVTEVGSLDEKELKHKLSLLELSLYTAKEDLRKAKTSVSDLEDRLDVLLASKKKTKHRIEHLSSDDGKCPTCGSDYVNKESATELASARSRLKALTRDLDSVAGELAGAKEALVTTAEYLEKLRIRHTKLESKLRVLDEYTRLKSYRSTAPSKPTHSQEQITYGLSNVDTVLDQLTSMLPMFELRDEWLAVDTHIKSRLKTLNLAEINAKMTEVSSKLAAARVEYERVLALRSEISEISDRITELNSKVDNLDALKVLESAFSKKGIEMILIRSLCASLEQQVNKYSKLLFPEDYTFTFELDTNFSILVTRVHNKNSETSDVRKLSGAERKLFSLVLLISLLSFVPKAKRTNLLVLDEPTAAMGEDNKASLIRFLPVLQSIIPNIVVITPLDKQDYSVINPRVWTVQKKGMQSRIVEGGPK